MCLYDQRIIYVYVDNGTLHEIYLIRFVVFKQPPSPNDQQQVNF